MNFKDKIDKTRVIVIWHWCVPKFCTSLWSHKIKGKLCNSQSQHLSRLHTDFTIFFQTEVKAREWKDSWKQEKEGTMRKIQTIQEKYFTGSSVSGWEFDYGMFGNTVSRFREKIGQSSVNCNRNSFKECQAIWSNYKMYSQNYRISWVERNT